MEAQEALLEGVRDGRYDMAISALNANEELYRVDPLYNEGYRLVISNDHALKDYNSVDLNTLSNTAMLDRPNCEMRDTLHQTCSERGHFLYARLTAQIVWIGCST